MLDKELPVWDRPYIRDLPAGSVVSSAADMGRFVSEMIRSQEGQSGFLEAPTVGEMWRKQNDGVPLDFDFSVGLTWWQVSLPDLPGVDLVGHGGDLDAFHALLAIDPRHKVGVFMMVNGVDGIGSFSLAPLAAEALRGMIEVKTGKLIPPARPAPARVPVPAGLGERISGYYATPQGLAQVRVTGDKLRIFAFGNWLDGVYHEDGTVSLEARLLFVKIPVPILNDISFTFESIGAETYLCLRTAGGTLIAPCRKVAPVAAPDSWLKRSGRYRIENPDPAGMLTGVSVGLDRSSGFFMLKLRLSGSPAAFPLQAVTDTEARIMGVGRSLGETLRVIQGPNGEKLSFHGYLLSKR